MPKKKAKSNKDVYEKAEDLPEGKKKIYDSILEDFDKQVAARIEQIWSDIGAIQTQVRSKFKVALLQLPRNIRSLKVEDFYYNNDENAGNIDLTLECAKVAVSVSNTISNEVQTTVKEIAKKKATTARRRSTKKKSSILAQGPSMTGSRRSTRTTKKKSSILAPPPTTGTRRSTRKRAAPSWLNETPLASSTLTAAALGGFSTAKTTRSKGRVAQTPLGAAGNISAFPSMITPKFDPATPLNRTATRTQRADEKFLVSMNGSPVYVGGRGSRAKNENLIPIPIGDGKTMMVPADNPEVQPIIQKLISSCMNIMNKK